MPNILQRERTVKRVILLFLGMLITTLAACSNGSENIPTVPVMPDQHTSETSSDHHMLWGLWQVAIDTRTSEVEIVPLRQAEMHANVVMYMQTPYPNSMNIQIESMDLGTGDFDLIVLLTHPFSDDTLYGFDVKGIFITNGIMSSEYDPSLVYTDKILHPSLQNQDGYTRWWNQVEFPMPGNLGYTEGVLGTQFVDLTCTLNPFKYFADHLDVDDEFYQVPGGRNHFSPGTTNSRRYLINFPTFMGNPLIVFNYAVDASWEPPVGPGGFVDAFPPEANQPEPYFIQVTDIGSNPWFDPDTEFSGGELKLQVQVFDYGITGDMSTVMDEIDSVVLESFSMFPGPVILTESDLSTAGPEFAMFETTIPVTPDGINGQEILIHGISAEGTYDQNYGTPAPDKPLAAYKIHPVTVSEGFPNPDPPVVTVEILRYMNGRLSGFRLEWDESPDAEQYFIYWSNDPYEILGPMEFELAPNPLIDVGEWEYNVAGAEVNGQWMLYVIARGVADFPTTDSGESNRVMIDFEAWEDYAEGLNEWRRRQNSIRNKFLAATTVTYGVDGSGSLLLTPNHSFYRHATAYCVSPELPDIPSATGCYFEFAHYRTYGHPVDYGYSVCSTPEILDPNIIDRNLYDPSGTIPDYMLIWDYNVDVVDGSNWVSGDIMNTSDIDGMFFRWNEQPEEMYDPTNGWSGPPSTGYEISRYEVPKVIDEDHRHVGVCFAGAELGSPQILIIPPQYPLLCDEFALVVY